MLYCLNLTRLYFGYSLAVAQAGNEFPKIHEVIAASPRILSAMELTQEVLICLAVFQGVT